MDITNPSQPKGKRTGLKGKEGSPAREAYWITLSAREDAKPFGSARGGETLLNARGKALAASWRELADLRDEVEPDALVIGPRRMQGIILFPRRRAGGPELPEVIRLFKVLSALRLAQLAKTADRTAPVTGARRAPATAGGALWKKGYSEQIITGAAALAEARKALKGLHAR